MDHCTKSKKTCGGPADRNCKNRVNDNGETGHGRNNNTDEQPPQTAPPPNRILPHLESKGSAQCLVGGCVFALEQTRAPVLDTHNTFTSTASLVAFNPDQEHGDGDDEAFVDGLPPFFISSTRY